MSFSGPFDPLHRRLAVYGYLAPLVAERRVLEVGSGSGHGAAHLKELGAASVLGADADAGAVSKARATHRMPGLAFTSLERRALESAGAFDVIVVPDGAAVLKAANGPTPAALKALLARDGSLVMLIPSADHVGAAAGVGYYEISEALERLFPRVRMFGLTPFAAFGLAEFSETVSGLRIDGGLVEEASEQPTHYLVIAGSAEAVQLGYALMQIPSQVEGADRVEGVDGTAPSLPDAPSGDLVELRRRLAEAEGQAEGMTRASRAQAEEIEELRARLRRGAEARAELDEEMARLRRGLTAADESVLTLTRRTTEEMAALAQRITGGLRPSSSSGGDDSVARDSTLSERDERIAALEAEKQDLIWQLEESMVAGEGTSPPVSRSADSDGAESDARARQREQALEQYQQAAIAHVEELNHLRGALAEQSTLVSELEEAVVAGTDRLEALNEETERLRRHTAEVEQADRARRSRLAEVEGTLLRLQRQAAVAASNEPTIAVNGRSEAVAAVSTAALTEAQNKIASLSSDLGGLEKRLHQAEALRSEAEQRSIAAGERVAELERAAAERSHAVVAPVESSVAVSAGDAARFELAAREVLRLRDALERSEEQLWETKGQLLLDRERMAVLEHQLSASAPTDSLLPPQPTVSEASHRAIVESVLKELAETESSVRVEIERLDSVERKIESWRADLAVTDAEGDVPFTRVD